MRRPVTSSPAGSRSPPAHAPQVDAPVGPFASTSRSAHILPINFARSGLFALTLRHARSHLKMADPWGHCSPQAEPNLTRVVAESAVLAPPATSSARYKQ